jgi:hypothetical protein
VVGATDWGTWEFDNTNSTSADAIAAFTDRTEKAYSLDVYTDEWNPVRQSAETATFPASYACDAPNTSYPGDGGCRTFWYADSSGTMSFNLDDDGGWAQTAFQGGFDSSGRPGVDFFEQDESAPYAYVTNEGAMYYR